MVKVLFINSHSGHEYWTPIGIASLSAYLKQQGHVVDLYDTTRKKLPEIEPELNTKIAQFNPDLIAISTLSASFDLAIAIAEFIKKHHDIKILFGGVHPTLVPEKVISYPCVDMVCMGEGELALSELLFKIENKENYFDTQNFYFKKGNAIIRNPVRPLIEDLDSLPFPDRSLFDDQCVLSDDGGVQLINIICGRGCPFDCYYCNNSFLNNLYKGKGKYVRMHSVIYVINEIKEILKTYASKANRPLKIYFHDDTFTLNKKWLKEFCDKYVEEIGLPFACLTRADTTSEEVFSLLKDAGCVDVSMGIETGNLWLRNNMLNRYQTDEQIITAYKTARKFGIKTISYNLIGIPHETKHTMMETIEINKKANPDIAKVSILQPYEGLQLYKISKEDGFLIENESLTSSQHSPSHLKFKELSKYDLEKIHDLFTLYVKYPNYLYPLFDLPYYLLYHLGQKDKPKKFLDTVALYQYVGIKRFAFLALRKIGIVHGQ